MNAGFRRTQCKLNSLNNVDININLMTALMM